MNPFNHRHLSKDELQKDCLCFLGREGKSVKASRLFLGQELREQSMKIGSYFGVEYHRYKTVEYQKDFTTINKENQNLCFKYSHLGVERFGYKEADREDLSIFKDFDHTYHQLIYELTYLQVALLQLVLTGTNVKNIFIDGGFVENELFINMLASKLPNHEIRPTQMALGSSLGAAILVNNDKLIDYTIEQ